MTGIYSVIIKMNDNWASSICFPSMLAWNTGIVIYHKIIGDYICCVAHDIPNARWVLLPLIGHYDMEALEAGMKVIAEILRELSSNTDMKGLWGYTACSKISHRQAAHTYSAAYCWQGFRQAFT